MLVDVKFRLSEDAKILRILHGENKPVRLSQGVYEISHFSFGYEIGLGSADTDNTYPLLHHTGGPDEYLGCYGVCDNWQQVVQQCAELQPGHSGLYAMSVTPIRKSEQPPEGGWRWHKWGAYIGTGKPTREYLYNEPRFEVVYVYHIYEIPFEKVAVPV